MAFAFRQAAAHLHLYSVRLTQRIMEQIRLQRKRHMSLGKLSDLEQAHNDLEPSPGSTVAAELNILCQDIAIERAARTKSGEWLIVAGAAAKLDAASLEECLGSQSRS